MILTSHETRRRARRPGMGRVDVRMALVAVAALVAALAASALPGRTVVSAADPSPTGEFTALTPARILDTRIGLGVDLVNPIGPTSSIDVQVTGEGGVPGSGVEAVVLNVTADLYTKPTWLRVYPTGQEGPQISSLNPESWGGTPVANLVTVPVGIDGKVSVYNEAGHVHVIFDVAGYYASDDGNEGSRYRPVDPVRIADTRHAYPWPSSFNPLSTKTLQVTGMGGVPATGTTAVVLNVTVAQPSEESYLTVYPADVARPLASNLNFGAWYALANQVIVRTPADGNIAFFNFAGETEVIVDLIGYYEDAGSEEAGRYVAMDPYRAIDTRVDSPFPPPGWLLGGDTLVYGDADEEYSAYVLNVTSPGGPRLSGYIVAYPHPGDLPGVSTVNYRGVSQANHAIVKTGPDMAFHVENGLTHIVCDVYGAFT